MSETTKIYSVNAKQAHRKQLQVDIDRFLASGGGIKKIESAEPDPIPPPHIGPVAVKPETHYRDTKVKHRYPEPTEKQKQILRQLERIHGRLSVYTIVELAAEIGCAVNSWRDRFEKLIDKGIIKQSGRDVIIVRGTNGD